MRGKFKYICIYFLGVFVTFLAIEGIKSFLARINWSFSHTALSSLIAILIGLLAIFCTVYCILKTNQDNPFGEVLKNFFRIPLGLV